MDGELSVSEIEEFETQLSDAELQHLKNEQKLEEGIGAILNDGPSCTINILDCINEAPKPKKFNRSLTAIITFAAAACIALVFMYPRGASGPKVPQTVAELKKLSITGNSLDDINKYLNERNIDLELTKFMPEHHEKTIIGAGVEIIGGEEVVTLMFTCCGRPAKVYVLPRGSSAEKLILEDDKEWKSSIQAQAKKGDYRLAVSSPHNSESLLAYINHT